MANPPSSKRLESDTNRLGCLFMEFFVGYDAGPEYIQNPE